jgi:ABC-type transporter Mla MlaB component
MLETDLRHGAASGFPEKLMLRMTRSAADGLATLILEGKLLQPWIGELQMEVTAIALAGSAIRLDLTALSFVDAAGARQLIELERQGLALFGATDFVHGLLQLQRR